MYSGFISSRLSLNSLGVHQKFNKAAYSLVNSYIEAEQFPLLEAIQRFEGYNGPDGLKIKSSGTAEPSHFYHPLEGEGSVVEHLQNHYDGLVASLRKGDFVRAAFEASWLAHAVCDGLTPAHHHDLDQDICSINGHGRRVRNKRDKLLLRGESWLETAKQTFKLVGAKGVLTNHVHFEIGVTFAVITTSFTKAFDNFDATWARYLGPWDFFQDQALRINKLSLYERFCRRGWTTGLAYETKYVLAPLIVEAIAAMWLLAYEEAYGDLDQPQSAPQPAFALADRPA